MLAMAGVEELVGLTGEGLNWDDFDATSEKRSIATSIVNALVNGAISRARQPDLLVSVIKKSVKENIDACLDAVDLNSVKRADNESQRQSLLSEPEVVHNPVDIDSWARGVLPVKVVSKSKLHGRSSRASTIGTPLKKITRELSVSEDSQKNLNKARVRDSTLKTTCLQPIVDSSNRKKLTQKEIELEQRLRDELEARKNAQEVLRLADAQDIEEKKRLQALQQELRGKEYAYDQSGQVVVLNRIDPDRLPPSSVSLKFRFSPKSKPPENPALASGAKRNESPLKKQTTGAKTNGVKVVPEFVKKTQSGLPSMMESMKIVSGVTIKEGDLVKTGPKQVESARGMTRTEYFNKKHYESAMTGGMDDAGVSGGGGTWAESTFSNQEFGVLQMIQSAEDPLLAGKMRSQSVVDGVNGGDSKSQVLGKPAEDMDINLVLTRAPDWGENSPTPGKVNLPKPPISRSPKKNRQTPNRSPRGLPIARTLYKENSYRS